ncbi:MAG TPA: rRNA methyltransferase [Alphaproteobacteria bacterium]|nr:rRNA methyltransferase [Alphaproteobacteria bacterium]HAJ46504.1 rRNA methyltransferase [Alphaproteobacteria bacterium]
MGEVDRLGPVIILADAQMGENIGAAARVMHNFGLSRLRLVRPRDGWPNPAAEAMATRGAAAIIENTQVFETVEQATADVTRVFAATARERYMQKAVVEPEACARACAEEVTAGGLAAILFGSERAGLENDDVSLADTILTIPCNPEFTSLNLAQSVAILAYEWMKLAGGLSVARPSLMGARPARREDLFGLFAHLEAELDRVEFLYPPAKRPAMVRNIRNMWHRANLTYQDVQTIRGMITALTRTPKRRKPRDE